MYHDWAFTDLVEILAMREAFGLCLKGLAASYWLAPWLRAQKHRLSWCPLSCIAVAVLRLYFLTFALFGSRPSTQYGLKAGTLCTYALVALAGAKLAFLSRVLPRLTS